MLCKVDREANIDAKDREYMERDNIPLFRNAGSSHNAGKFLLVYAPHNTGVAHYESRCYYIGSNS